MIGYALLGQALAAIGSSWARAPLTALFLVACLPLASAQTVVPPGNRYVEQPGVPGGSTKRTNAGKTTFDAKYRKVYALLETDGELRGKIVKAA